MARREDYPNTFGLMAPEVLAEMLIAELSMQEGEMVDAIKAPLGAGFRDLIANPDLWQGIPLEEFGKLWVAMWQQAIREQKPYLDYLIQQGLIDSNAKLNLVPYNPMALPESYVDDETFSIQQAMALARTYITNFDEIADQYGQMYDELGGVKLLERPRILHCGNHSDFFDTVMPNIFFANYFSSNTAWMCVI